MQATKIYAEDDFIQHDVQMRIGEEKDTSWSDKHLRKEERLNSFTLAKGTP